MMVDVDDARGASPNIGGHRTTARNSSKRHLFLQTTAPGAREHPHHVVLRVHKREQVHTWPAAAWSRGLHNDKGKRRRRTKRGKTCAPE